MKTYEIETTEEKFEEGLAMLGQKGGSYYEDGSFEIMGVKGTAVFEKGILTIEVTDKPWLASWDMIYDKIIDFFY